MADTANSDLNCLKHTKITVLVDEALPDLLVVTYEYGVKIFKGVLLDSTKKNLPYGVQSLNPSLIPPKKPEDDPLYAVSQRFAYTDPSNAKKKNVQFPNKYKNNRMTVRLRPRQVLCSKCKGICNENSENVSRKRKSSETMQTPISSPIKRSLNAPMTRSVYSEQLINNRKHPSRGATLVPKLTRLTAEEEQRALSGNFSNKLAKKPISNAITSNSDENEFKPETKKHSDNEHSEHITGSSVSTNKEENQSQKALLEPKPARSALRMVKRQLRKKRTTGSVEEPSEEVAVEEKGLKNSEENETVPVTGDESSNVHNIASNTRTIKICYGPQGEGTVLKIPAKINTLESKGEAEKNPNVEKQKTTDFQNKEARRALKKAKREARRKVLVPSNSPLYIPGASPRYALGASSPRYTVGGASPRQALGSNSPRYICTSLEINMPRKRKHKMKHKKKHRENKDRKHKEGEVSSSTHEETKEQNATQKLSINLKRLQSRYTSSDNKDDNSSSSDDQNEQVPDFPPPAQPLMLRINAQTVSSASGVDGARLLVGDVVWGKIHGFPWWPGKILTITNCNNRDFQAHVSWYGSSTSSLMQCDQLSPYLEHFKIRYNKKKRGPYKEAIKQATNDARENAESKARQPISNSPSHNLISQVIPPALASPREINVAS